MFRQVLAILVTLSVAFANGVCPCGLASAVKGVVGWHDGATVQNRVVHRTCPACRREGRNPDSDNGQRPNVEKCALMVSGDVPTIGVAVPPLDLMPVSFSLPLAEGRISLGAVDRVASLLTGLSPPTLLNLSCCLNT